MSEPQVLILDEATANVDTATEQRIQEAIARLLPGLPCADTLRRLLYRWLPREPAQLDPAEGGAIGLSEPVRAAVSEAVRLVTSLVRELRGVVEK